MSALTREDQRQESTAQHREQERETPPLGAVYDKHLLSLRKQVRGPSPGSCPEWTICGSTGSTVLLLDDCESDARADPVSTGASSSSEAAVCKDPFGTIYRRLPPRTAAVNRHRAVWAPKDRSRRSAPFGKEGGNVEVSKNPHRACGGGSELHSFSRCVRRRRSVESQRDAASGLNDS
jgi:hypothetical protein